MKTIVVYTNNIAGSIKIEYTTDIFRIIDRAWGQHEMARRLSKFFFCILHLGTKAGGTLYVILRS